MTEIEHYMQRVAELREALVGVLRHLKPVPPNDPEYDALDQAIFHARAVLGDRSLSD